MKELLHVTMEYDLPENALLLGVATGARLPWAEDHFQERVSGKPLNPAPSEAWWPFRQNKSGNTNEAHKSEGGQAFSHTYPERMWPKFANPIGDGIMDEHDLNPMMGIRFNYGDLVDVVKQLVHHPMTRQAYLPIWFPEDTGAVKGQRVPCTLGYHFIIRDGKLDISYFMRSTDLLRHFQDDVYMAGRLAQWMVDEINFSYETSYYGDVYPTPDEQKLEVGKLIFHTANMHIFVGDVPLINYWESQGKVWY